MNSMIALKALNFVGSLRKQRGAVAWEYLLVIGVISVAIVGGAAVLANGTPGMVDQVCIQIGALFNPDTMTAGCPAA